MDRSSCLNDFHCLKVFCLPRDIREPGIAARNIDACVTQQLLKALQAHSRVEHLSGEGVPQLVQSVALVLQTCSC